MSASLCGGLGCDLAAVHLSVSGENEGQAFQRTVWPQDGEEGSAD